MRTLLLELGLRSSLETDGGKELHVLAPTATRMNYDAIKNFRNRRRATLPS
jgi:DNA primase